MTETLVASRRRRILAFMIDHIILSFLGAVGGLLAMGKHWDMAGDGRMMPATTAALLAGLLLLGYLLKDVVRGMSPGRFVLGIAVRDAANLDKSPSVVRHCVRNLLVVLWPIELLVLVFSKEKRRLGDRFARTVLLRREDIQWTRRLPAFLGLVVVLGFLFAGSTSLIIERSAAYEHALAYIDDSAEVRESIGHVTGYGRPGGSVNVENQYGTAQIKLTVTGLRGAAPVVVTMRKEPGKAWTLQKLDIEI